MKTPTRKEVTKLFESLRAIAPDRPLTYGESLQAARLQAAKLREWAGNSNVAEFELGWLVSQSVVPVQFAPGYVLHEESGMTTDLLDGKLQMYINEREPHVRQRFSLLHELKHAIDFPVAATLHQSLGVGDDGVKGLQIELIANEFAAQVLMPAPLVKRVWRRTEDIALAASLFNVSREAMRVRLVKLGFIERPEAVKRAYFRTAGLYVQKVRSAPALCA